MSQRHASWISIPTPSSPRMSVRHARRFWRKCTNPPSSIRQSGMYYSHFVPPMLISKFLQSQIIAFYITHRPFVEPFLLSNPPPLPPPSTHELSVIIMALPFDKINASSPDVGRIKSNLPPKVKQTLDTVMHEIMAQPNIFRVSIGERVVITEASIVPKSEESSRTEVWVICEITGTEGPSPSPVARFELATYFSGTSGYFLGVDVPSLCIYD